MRLTKLRWLLVPVLVAACGGATTGTPPDGVTLSERGGPCEAAKPPVAHRCAAGLFCRVLPTSMSEGTCEAAESDASANMIPCITDDHCPAGLQCGYPTADLCFAMGVCVRGNCQATSCISPAGLCACDGGPIAAVQAEVSPGVLKITYTSVPSSGRIGPCTPQPVHP